MRWIQDHVKLDGGQIMSVTVPASKCPAPFQQEENIEDIVNSGEAELTDFAPYDLGDSVQFSWFHSGSAHERYD